MEIAHRYLIPRQLHETGLTEAQLSVPDDTLRQVLSKYTREAGVRELERALARLNRKIAFQVAGGKATGLITISPSDLPDMLGPERFFLESIRGELPPGVAMASRGRRRAATFSTLKPRFWSPGADSYLQDSWAKSCRSPLRRRKAASGLRLVRSELSRPSSGQPGCIYMFQPAPPPRMVLPPESPSRSRWLPCILLNRSPATRP